MSVGSRCILRISCCCLPLEPLPSATHLAPFSVSLQTGRKVGNFWSGSNPLVCDSAANAGTSGFLWALSHAGLRGAKVRVTPFDPLVAFFCFAFPHCLLVAFLFDKVDFFFLLTRCFPLALLCRSVSSCSLRAITCGACISEAPQNLQMGMAALIMVD